MGSTVLPKNLCGDQSWHFDRRTGLGEAGYNRVCRMAAATEANSALALGEARYQRVQPDELRLGLGEFSHEFAKN